MSELPDIKQILEGAILAAGRPLAIDVLIQLFAEHEQPSRAEVKEVLAAIEADCEGRGFELKEVASGYRFQVRSEYGAWVGRLWEERPPKYTRAFLETLALIAYKQPITRGDIEDIRGVSVSTNIMRSLLEREWIRVVGHRDVPGRPAIYATTKTFLDYFDLASLDGLPSLSEIRDLDKMNEELDLDMELIEPRTLDLAEVDDEAASADTDDAILQEVTNKVNTIQENIRNLFKEPEDDRAEEDDLAEEEEDAEIEGDKALEDAPVTVDEVDVGHVAPGVIIEAADSAEPGDSETSAAGTAGDADAAGEAGDSQDLREARAEDEAEARESEEAGESDNAAEEIDSKVPDEK